MDRILQVIEFIYKMLRRDWDSVVLIVGDEGISKSNLGLWMIHAYYELMRGKCIEEDIKHMCLDSKQFTADLRDLVKYELTVYDEAGDLLKRRALSDFNVKIMKAYQVIRGDNLCTVLILPSLFDLDSFFSERRVKHLFFVYRRGRVAYYSQKRLRTLIALNKTLPVKNMSLVKPTFFDNFPIYKGVLAEPYKKKKLEKMKKVRKDLHEDIEKIEQKLKPVKRIITECLECGYIWHPRSSNPPLCPKCKKNNYTHKSESVNK